MNEVINEKSMSLDEVLTTEDYEIINEANDVFDGLYEMLNEVQNLREMLSEKSELTEKESKLAHKIIDEISSQLPDEEYDELLEKVERQFRRYSGQDTLKRQYRCTTGPKAGRIVTSPEKCGKRKDPMAVRRGKKASRVKKGQRVRKSLFTKRKSTSKRLQRLNKAMRGDS